MAIARPTRYAGALTPRELEVLAAYVETESYLATALALDIAWPTARNHMHAAYRKLGVSTVLGAAKVLGWLVTP